METRAPFVIVGAFIVAAIVAVFGFVYWLHNSAGIGADTPFLDTTIDQFRRILDVNVIGSLAIGYWMGGPHDSKSVSETSRLFFVVGVLGGLTTFSSLAYETMWLTDHRNSGITAGLGHMSANVILGLGAVWLGVWLGRSVSAT